MLLSNQSHYYYFPTRPLLLRERLIDLKLRARSHGPHTFSFAASYTASLPPPPPPKTPAFTSTHSRAEEQRKRNKKKRPRVLPASFRPAACHAQAGGLQSWPSLPRPTSHPPPSPIKPEPTPASPPFTPHQGTARQGAAKVRQAGRQQHAHPSFLSLSLPGLAFRLPPPTSTSTSTEAAFTATTNALRPS